MFYVSFNVLLLHTMVEDPLYKLVVCRGCQECFTVGSRNTCIKNRIPNIYVHDTSVTIVKNLKN